MGHHHVAFVIARVRANRDDPVPKYRCVGAIHQHYGFGRVPLAGTYRFMKLATQDDNGAIIRDELRRYAELSKRNPERPCNYVTSLCEEAFSLEIEKRHNMGGISDHRANVDTKWLSNSMTVLDVSDPKNISVSFVHIPSHEANNKDPRVGIPLTPEQYLDVYHGLEEKAPRYYNQDEQEHFAAKVKDVPMVSLATLAEVWPDEYKAPQGEVTQALAKHEAQGAVPSLADLSMDWAITHAIKENQVDLLEHIIRLPGKSAAVLGRITSLEELPSSAVQLLNKHFKTSPTYPREVDLSGYALSGPQVLKFLGQLGAVDVEHLNVSGNEAVDKAGLSSILRSAPKLRWLNVMNTGVTHEDVEGLLEAHPELFYHIDTFLHPFFYENSKRPYPYHSSCGFWFATEDPKERAMGEGIPSVPLLSTDCLIQCIFDYGHFADENELGGHYAQDTGTRVKFEGRVAIHSSGIRPFESRAWDSLPTRNIPFRARRLDTEKRSRSKYIFILWGIVPLKGPCTWTYGILVGPSEPISEPKDTGRWERESGSYLYQGYERCVDVRTFLELLQQEGRPPPSDLVKLQQVYDIFSKSNFQLASLDSLQEQAEVIPRYWAPRRNT